MTPKLSRHWRGSSFGHSPVQGLQAALGGLKILRMRFDGVFQQPLAHVTSPCLMAVSASLYKSSARSVRVLSRMLWKFPCGVLRACEGLFFQAARSRGIGSMG